MPSGSETQLQNRCNRTYAIQCVFAGIIIGRVSLSQQKNLLVTRHRSLKGFDGLLAPHEQRDNHVRIHHDIAQWQERQFDGCLHDFASTAALGPETDGSKLETKMGAALKKNKH